MEEKVPNRTLLEEKTGPSSEAAGVRRQSSRLVENIRQLLMRGGPLLGLVLLAAYLSFAAPHFLTVGNIINISRQTAITAILAVGQTFVILSAGIDLSVGAVAALAGSVSAVMMTQRIEFAGLAVGPVSFWLGLPIALLVGTLAGMINGVVITRGGIPDFIATLGTLASLRGIALLVTGGLPVPSHLTATELKGYLPEQILWLGGGSILGLPVAGLIAIVMVVLGWVLLRYTALGRSIFAVGGNREAARVSGIDVDGIKVAVYTLSGLLAAVASVVLAGRLNSANALMAEGEELNSIAAVVIGGTNLFGGEGGVGGSLIGALIMGVLANGLNLLNVGAFWQRVVRGLVIVLVVVFDQWRRRRLGE